MRGDRQNARITYQVFQKSPLCGNFWNTRFPDGGSRGPRGHDSETCKARKVEDVAVEGTVTIDADDGVSPMTSARDGWKHLGEPGDEGAGRGVDPSIRASEYLLPIADLVEFLALDSCTDLLGFCAGELLAV